MGKAKQHSLAVKLHRGSPTPPQLLWHPSALQGLHAKGDSTILDQSLPESEIGREKEIYWKGFEMLGPGSNNTPSFMAGGPTVLN